MWYISVVSSAVSCDHVAVVRHLMSQNADVSIQDNEQQCPLDLAESDEIRHILKTRWCHFFCELNLQFFFTTGFIFYMTFSILRAKEDFICQNTVWWTLDKEDDMIVPDL